MADDRFPDIVYRLGATESVRGVMCDTLRVDSEAERDAAVAAGWSILPPTEAPIAAAQRKASPPTKGT